MSGNHSHKAKRKHHVFPVWEDCWALLVLSVTPALPAGEHYWRYHLQKQRTANIIQRKTRNKGRCGVSILSLGTSALPDDSVSSADLISTLPMSLSSHRFRRAASRGRRLGREPPLGMCTHPPGPPASISCEAACLPEPLQAWCQQSHLRGPGRER